MVLIKLESTISLIVLMDKKYLKYNDIFCRYTRVSSVKNTSMPRQRWIRTGWGEERSTEGFCSVAFLNSLISIFLLTDRSLSLSLLVSLPNSLRYVNCARNEREQNLVAFQYQGGILYRCSQPIEPGQELLMWYEEDYAKDVTFDYLWNKKCSENSCV